MEQTPYEAPAGETPMSERIAMARGKQRARFETLQTAARVAAGAWQTLKVDLTFKYGDRAYASRTETAKLDRLHSAETRTFNKFTDYLASISPRDWRSGVPCVWLRDSLTFDDAITRGQLSTVPPAAWGSDVRELVRFAQPVNEVSK